MNAFRTYKLEIWWLLVILFLGFTPATFVAQEETAWNWLDESDDCDSPVNGWCIPPAPPP